MPRLITIAQQKGGAGKTTVAAHIAVSLAQTGRRTAIIDIDPQASLAHWYNLREQKFGVGYTGLKFINSSGWRIESAVRNLEDEFDYVIIDAPPHTDTESKSAIRISELIIIPMQASPTDLWATTKTLSFAKGENKMAKILLNRFNPLSKISKNIAAEINNNEVLKSYLGSRVAFSSCFLDGTTVNESFPSSEAAREIRQLTTEILALVENKISAKEHKLENA